MPTDTDQPTAADQIQAVVLTPEDERREQNDRNWIKVLDGIDRASAWLKANRQHLGSFHIQLVPSPTEGITINLSLFGDDDRRAQTVKSLFSGRRAEKRISDNGNSTTFTVLAYGLRFRWSVWKFVEEPPPMPEEVTI